MGMMRCYAIFGKILKSVQRFVIPYMDTSSFLAGLNVLIFPTCNFGKVVKTASIYL
jgi:hypothetical protein